MAFSSSLLLADLDYIAPSQACIKPMLQNSDGSVYIHGKGDAPPIPIKITLQDCLACSGCVTTAETMLVTSQSKEEVESFKAANPTRPIVVSISDPSAASLAIALGCSIPEAFERIAGFAAKHLSAAATIDLRWALAISQEETTKEYVHRLKHAKHLLPMMISSCPGWVCYCEKTHPQLLPMLCTVMSPQGIGGSYLKHKYPNAYHISVQPCFDRKLEAVREDFAIGTEGDKMTDCVLSTHELFLWMEEVGLDPALKAPLAPTIALRRPLGAAVTCEAAGLQGSGAYHQKCIEAAMKDLSGANITWDALQYQTKRNANHRIISMPGTPIGEVCIAYGFQHIQNLVRGINRKMPSVAKHTLIEVMACPEGCLNGGGQVRTANNQETLSKVSTSFQENEEVLALATSGKAAPSPSGEPPVTLGPRTEAQTQTQPELIFSPLSDPAWATVDATTGFLTRSRVTFRDRKAEMEQADNIVHSLKW
eukprot:GILI01018755.1.p1 GENE.GILI01018755.1~~GILI01018755.1.p1  ORF type:complete len:480 (-),score=96.89 GILI01018755.1:88-1527(-)